VINAQISQLQRELRGPGIHFSWNNPTETLVEAFLTRGDRRLADVIELAWRKGARLEGWSDYFNFGAWQAAFAELGLDMDWYARRERPLDEALPWDHISAGLKKEFLTQEYIHTYQGGVVDDCREHCFSCGILGRFKEQRRAAPDDGWGCPPPGARQGSPARERHADPALLQRRHVARPAPASSLSACRSAGVGR
jgi:hypothetical protein